jgi:hypothetical protein
VENAAQEGLALPLRKIKLLGYVVLLVAGPLRGDEVDGPLRTIKPSSFASFSLLLFFLLTIEEISHPWNPTWSAAARPPSNPFNLIISSADTSSIVPLPPLRVDLNLKGKAIREGQGCRALHKSPYPLASPPTLRCAVTREAPPFAPPLAAAAFGANRAAATAAFTSELLDA